MRRDVLLIGTIGALFAICTALSISLILSSRKVSEVNQAKLDVSLCIFSVSPTRRTPTYVKGCYDLVEQQTDVKLQRFGDGHE